MVQDHNYRELASLLVARHLDEALDVQVSCWGDVPVDRGVPPRPVRRGYFEMTSTTSCGRSSAGGIETLPISK
ncbi:MAG: hypothetical protein SV966_02605 [Actinomycetota bacterium]|nr:hypothetical protein [Actinomycetota bacterium]